MNQVQILSFLFFLLLTVSSLALADISTVVPTDEVALANEPYKQLAQHFEILRDHVDEYSPFEILLPDLEVSWSPVDGGVLNLGYIEEPFWLKLKLNAQASIYKRWDLVVSSTLVDYIDVYQVFPDSGPRIIYRSGMSRPFKNRTEEHRYFIVPLDIFENPETLLIRIETTGASYIPMQLYPENQFWATLQIEDSINWVFYGIILAMALYNLFVYFAIKDRSYLFYVLFITSFSLVHLSLDGYLFQYFWPENKPFSDVPDTLFLSLSIIFSFLFISSFLNLKTHIPRLNRFLLVICLLQAPIILGSLHYTELKIAIWVLPFIALFLAISVLLGLYSGLKGLVTARYFVLAWVIFAVGNTYLISVYMGMNAFSFSPLMVSKLSSFVEAMLLSFALASRIRELRVERETQQMKAKAQSYFFAQISHEIRTPLNGVLGTIELLSQTNLDKEQRSYSNIIQSSGRSLLMLVNDVLDYSKIESGKMTLQTEDISIRDLIRFQVELYRSSAEQKKVELTLHIDNKVPKWIESDTQRIRQITSNLISNAIKFTDKGYVRVFLSVETDGDKPQVILKVKDSGIGIVQAEQNDIFNAYQQIDVGKRRVYGGTGLGLAISKELIELLGGSISLTSDVNVGSEFTVHFPLQIASGRQQTKDEDSTKQIHSLSILVAEDNMVNQKVIQGLLSKAGHEVTVVSQGNYAVSHRINAELNFDLILMDCEMPSMDGYEATKLIRNFEKRNGLPEIPIIALTAHALEEVRQRCLQSGMNDFLSKPINTSQLHRKIANIV